MSQKETFLNFISSQIGKPYKIGETGPNEYDCSGLIYAGLKELTSEEIPRVSTDQYELGTSIELTDLKAGDLMFFDTGWTDRKPNHLGVCISSTEMINANTYYNSVKTESFNSGYWQSKIYGTPKRIFSEDGALNLISSPTPSIPTFTDLPSSHQYYQYILNLFQKGVIAGYPDNTFKPESEINRVEALKIILLALNIQVSETFDPLPFSDTKKGEWYEKYIATGVKEDILQGYPDNTFKPSQNINFAEISKVIFKTGSINPELPSTSPYDDVKVTDWFANYILKAVEWDMFSPESSSHFGSATFITRAQMCKGIVKFLENK